MDNLLKASIAALAGIAVSGGSMAFSLWPAQSPMSALSLPALSCIGFLFLLNWREASKTDSPLWQYTFLVLCAFFIFGFALTPNLSPNMQLASISIALLVAPLVEFGSRFEVNAEAPS